jgi:DNA-binding protein
VPLTNSNFLVDQSSSKLQGDDPAIEQGAAPTSTSLQQNPPTDTIVLQAMGRAINKAVTIAEILKRKLPLHQVNRTTSVAMVDVYAPMEEGLDMVTTTRYVSCLTITLSLNVERVDVNDVGYQPPLPDSERNLPSSNQSEQPLPGRRPGGGMGGQPMRQRQQQHQQRQYHTQGPPASSQSHSQQLDFMQRQHHHSQYQ